MDPFQYFPIELVEEIFSYIEGYSSARKNIANPSKRKFYTIKYLIANGNKSLIQWIRKDKPLSSWTLNIGIVLATIEGNKDLVILFKKFGATEFSQGMLEAARGGHKDLVLLFKEWGATKFDYGMLEARKRGHKDLVLLFKEWIEERNIHQSL